MYSKSNALLYRMSVSLTKDGEIAVDFEGPPEPNDIEKAFDDWDKDFEHTKKIVSLVEYLRDYSNKQYEDLKSFI